MDLRTNYMGLKLANPLIASASPLNAQIEIICRLADAGAAAVVLPSIFEEEIGTDSYLELVRQAVDAVDIPIIGSINGVTDKGWTSYARDIAQAGAHGIELNIYLLPTDLAMSGREVEHRYIDVLRAVKAEVTIPVAVKLSPYFSAMGAMAKELDAAGADALVMFNRFYQPDIDLQKLALRKDLQLSSASEIRLPLLWIGVLHGRLRASLAATTGVETADQVVKYLLAGADAVMTTSSILRHGPDHMATILAGLLAWLDKNGFEQLDQLRGMLSHKRAGGEAVLFERANYIDVLESYGFGPG